MLRVEPIAGVVPRRAWIDRAIGLVTTQLECSPATAVVLMQRRADLIGCSIGDLSYAVIDGHIGFANHGK